LGGLVLKEEGARMTVEPSLIISFVALLLSIFSIYQKWLKPRHPKIAFLINPEETYRSVLRPYEGLPIKYQQEYPKYPEKHPGYIIVHFPFGNTGDEAGLVKVVSVDVQNPPGWSEEDKIKASFYNYCVVPTGGIAVHTIVLRNIPPLDKEKVISAAIKVEWGEPEPKTGGFVRKGGKEYLVQILIVPSRDVGEGRYGITK